MKMRGDFVGPQRSSTDKTTLIIKVSKGAKISNQYNQVPHLTQATNGKVTNSQLDTTTQGSRLLDTTNESQEVSPFPAGEPDFFADHSKSVLFFGNPFCYLCFSFCL